MIFRREQTTNLTNAEIIEKLQKEILERNTIYTNILIITPNVKETKELWYKIAEEKFNITDFRPKGLIGTLTDIKCAGLCEQFGDTKVVVEIHNQNDFTLDTLLLNDYVVRLRGEMK